MKRTRGFTLSIVATTALLATLSSGPAAGQTPPDGKQIFLAQKCNLCHDVSSAGIAATTKSEKVKGPDLTGKTAKLDVKLLGDFLHKKAEIDGKKHAKLFTGSDPELAALIAWLQQQDKK